jgi:hypothetical protein
MLSCKKNSNMASGWGDFVEEIAPQPMENSPFPGSFRVKYPAW